MSEATGKGFQPPLTPEVMGKGSQKTTDNNKHVGPRNEILSFKTQRSGPSGEAFYEGFHCTVP